MSAATAGGERNREIVLVVEDDRALREGLAMNLRLRGYDARTAADGEEGMRMAFDDCPDLIVLDISLPGWNGLEILEELRKRGRDVPVLILSARGSAADKVRGLDLGADDYMGKPFDLRELTARVEAMLRRRRTEGEGAPPLTVGDIAIDCSARTVRVRGRPAVLSAREFDLLRFMAAAPGRVFTREDILQGVWGWDYEGTARTVDNFVASLRRKLGAGRRGRARITTVRRVGYKLEVTE